MKQVYPEHYPSFKCIAGRCGDSCCIGWEIDIDRDAHARYMTQQGEFGRRLRENIAGGETPHFVLKGERCPFLNGGNLCDIIVNMGEGALCEICDQHPRFHEWFGEVKESGVGLCCEEAARLILKNEAPMRLVQSETDEAADEFEDEGVFLALREAREALFALLQNREYSVWERLAAAVAFGCALQGCLDGDDPEQAAAELAQELRRAPEELTEALKNGGILMGGEEERKALGEILEFFAGLEPIDESWPVRLRGIRAELGGVLNARAELLCEYRAREYEYEHLAVYFVYRYLLKATFDGDVLAKVKLAAASVLMISLLDAAIWKENGEFTTETRAQNAKAYSKEVEYCEENLARFEEASWALECFSTEGLLTLLKKAGEF